MVPKRSDLYSIACTTYFLSGMTTGCITWLCQQGRAHPKHNTSWTHAGAVCAIHYTTVLCSSVVLHDYLVPKLDAPCKEVLSQDNALASSLALYATFILFWRLRVVAPGKPYILYEYCWLCNISLWIGALSIATGRPTLACAYCVTVGIDQLLWYADVFSYMVSGIFLVGVARYLTWPQNANWTSRLTCTHHLWTIPVLLCSSGGRFLVWETYALSAFAMVVNVALSRAMTPETLVRDDKYLNVNLSHSVWKDISFFNIDHPAAHVYLPRLLWRWQFFNTLVFGFLYMSCEFAFDHAVMRAC